MNLYKPAACLFILFSVSFGVFSETVSDSFSSLGPVNPLRARELRISGVVKISVDVNSSCTVDNVRILEASPANMFEGTVRRHIRHGGLRFDCGGVPFTKSYTFYFDPSIDHGLLKAD